MKLIFRLCFQLVLILLSLAGSIYFLYIPVTDGVLHLKRAKSESVLMRQAPHGIQHVRADSLEMALYTQGFGHAQDRMWQMEKIRRLTAGRLAETLGEEAVGIDQFGLLCGFRRTAQETWDTPGVLSDDQKRYFQAYADGVNDFLDGVGMFNEDQTAKMLPPEFVLLGNSRPDPWHPVDSLATMRLIFLHLSFSWTTDYLRDLLSTLENGELRSIADELAPFRAEHTIDMMTILDDDDMKADGLYDEKTIMEKFNAVKSQREKEQSDLKQKQKQQKKDRIPERKRGGPESRTNLDDIYASNAWVIHGNYTKSGKPLLASDPHLMTDANCFWTIQHLEYKHNVKGTEQVRHLSGASAPGVPLVLVGTTGRVSWGITNPIVDVSDLYYETFNERGTHYMLDGEWKELKSVVHEIKVSGGKTQKFEIKYTHRGPIWDSKVISDAQLLFGPGQIPAHEETGPYSFAWAGHVPGETLVENFLIIAESDSIPEYREAFRRQIKHWNSVPGSVVMTDDSGNIAYQLLTPTPKRKNWYPYVGMNIIDGSSSYHDWEGTVETSELPFAINPKKGYFVSANNRIVPENSKSDIGAESISTTRGLRLRELIEEGLKREEKLTVEDMLKWQEDLTDKVARDSVPHIIKITERVLENAHEYKMMNVYHKVDIGAMLDYLRDFKGYMGVDRIDATVYQYWNYFFYSSLFRQFTTDSPIEKQQLEKDPKTGKIQQVWSFRRRMGLVDHYSFMDYYKRLILAISEDRVTELQNKICQNDYEVSMVERAPSESRLNTAYEGPNYCAYNVARSFLETKHYLFKEISPHPEDWKWGLVHVNEYPMLPWSETPLKPLWHREAPAGGNMNTPSVSKTVSSRIPETKIFRATHAANFKMVVEYGGNSVEPIQLASLDTGMNGNLLAGHYFDMNKPHLEGKLQTIPRETKEVEMAPGTQILRILPLSSAEKIDL